MKSTADYEFVKQSGQLIGQFSLSQDYKVYTFPASIDIVSERTGVVMTFKRVEINDPWHDPDFWDGEMMIYRPTEPCNVKILVLRA